MTNLEHMTEYIERVAGPYCQRCCTKRAEWKLIDAKGRHGGQYCQQCADAQLVRVREQAETDALNKRIEAEKAEWLAQVEERVLKQQKLWQAEATKQQKAWQADAEKKLSEQLGVATAKIQSLLGQLTAEKATPKAKRSNRPHVPKRGPRAV